MSRYDENWERLVGAVFRREHDREVARLDSSNTRFSSLSVSSDFDQLSLSFTREDEHGENGRRNSTIDSGSNQTAAKIFTFRELAAATRNFHSECLIRVGGFGRVYKGLLESSNEVVAIKQLDSSGLQGVYEFLVEVLMMSVRHHPNIVNLVGCCGDVYQRLLVYQYMPLGSLEDHLHDPIPGEKQLDWNTRMKIASGAAKGLEHLHHKASPPVIHRNLKCSNIMLGEDYHPKLSDFGLAKLWPVGDRIHLGPYGCCAPETAFSGRWTLKSDVYNFGIVLLEIISGKKAFDHSKTDGEQTLIAWARPLFKDETKFSQIADPVLQGRYPTRGLFLAVSIAAMCVQGQPSMRPSMTDVVTTLTYLASQTYDPQT